MKEEPVQDGAFVRMTKERWEWFKEQNATLARDLEAQKALTKQEQELSQWRSKELRQSEAERKSLQSDKWRLDGEIERLQRSVAYHKGMVTRLKNAGSAKPKAVEPVTRMVEQDRTVPAVSRVDVVLL
jgi:predicted RNase H-like nuclease (RuvC/YqgF family)